MEFKSNAFLSGERKWIAAITTCFVNLWLIFKTQEQKYFFSQIRRPYNPLKCKKTDFWAL